jgi:hypothetical protein
MGEVTSVMATTVWSRDELLVALALYCQIPFGRMHSRNPTIMKVAQRIGRTSSALAMKLTNFASLDSEVTGSGRRGLANVSGADRRIWDEMQADWLAFAVNAERATVEFGAANMLEAATEEAEKLIADHTGKEKLAQRAERIGQQYFRRSVLSAYGYKCCITGLSVRVLLLASHIVPWRVDPSNRLNPRNGLCLSALHDRAFDAGLITVAEDMTIRVSARVRAREDRFFESSLGAYSGRPIDVPEKFRPNPEFLQYHRDVVFQSSILG